ncbi:uncharacterized protein B0T15DRAFT_168301 [Chaetomium strumarium]|uniref:Major facilitator superfamily (MFS) profile domain-containing protein n=1 Tax=Chaetomium strumarium TaxID=1170767 RepID=A0AAJ0GW88_9PEZI|nr:hypothetical protein B0T15DRAFT_168301 [Chaetomium strumarium]
MALEKPPVLPIATSAERRSCSHRQPCIQPNTTIDRQKGDRVVRLATICLASFATGLSGIPLLLALPEPSSTGGLELDNSLSFHRLAHTALPFSLGAILAAAFIDPILRHSRACRSFPPFLLVPANILIGTGHAALLLLLLLPPMFRLPRDLSTALTAAAHLLIGAGSTVNLTTAILLLPRGSSSTPSLLGLINGVLAMGVVVTQTLCCCTGNMSLDDAGTPRWRHHLAALILALSCSCYCCSALFSLASQASSGSGWGTTPAAGGGCEEAEAEAEALDDDDKKKKKILPLQVNRGQGGFPPPASRLTLLGAVFTFAYQAAMVVVPVWLVLLIGGGGPGSSTGQVPLVYALLTFWAGIGVGSLALIPSVERSKQLMFSALVLSTGLLLLVWLFVDVFWNAVAAAGLVGFFMGPAYPWMVALLIRETSDEERAGGTAIVIAFGTSGTVTALFITQLADQLESPALLHLAVVGLFGGMLMSWNAMLDAKKKPELMGQGQTT